MSREKTCSFTGHRSIPNNEIKRIKSQLRETVKSLIDKGYTYFCSGGAIGFDMLAAETVLSLKRKNPQIQLFLILPCRGQDRYWTLGQKLSFQKLIHQADRVIFTGETYEKGCMHVRNRYLVDHSSVLVAYLEKDSGGTKYTVDYAIKNFVPVIRLGHDSPQQTSFYDKI